MGFGLVTKCSACHDEREFFLYVGMCTPSIGHIIDNSHYRTREKIFDFLDKGEERSYNFSNKIFVCARCQVPHSRFWAKIEREDGKVFETEFKCPKCRSVMVAINDEDTDELIDEITKYRCRKCGEKSLMYIGDILWD